MITNKNLTKWNYLIRFKLHSFKWKHYAILEVKPPFFYYELGVAYSSYNTSIIYNPVTVFIEDLDTQTNWIQELFELKYWVGQIFAYMCQGFVNLINTFNIFLPSLVTIKYIIWQLSISSLILVKNYSTVIFNTRVMYNNTPLLRVQIIFRRSSVIFVFLDICFFDSTEVHGGGD